MYRFEYFSRILLQLRSSSTTSMNLNMVYIFGDVYRA